MHRYIYLIIIFLICHSAKAQINVSDTLHSIMDSKIPDTLRIDKLNDYIYTYAPNHPEITMIYSDSAIMLSKQLKDSLRLANSFTRKGSVLYYLGDYNGALENYLDAVKIKEVIGQKSTLWREYNNIGLVLRNQDQNYEALKYFNIALNLIPENDKKFIAICWNNIGISYLGLKQYDYAENAILRSLEINNTINEKQSIAYNYNNLGIVYLNKYDYEKAEAYFNNALIINKELFNRFEQVENLNNIARVSIATSEYKKAFTYIENSMKIINQINSGKHFLDNIKIRIEYYTAVKDYKNALKSNKTFNRILDSLYNTEKTKLYDQLKTISNIEKEVQKVEFLTNINTFQKDRIRKQHIIEIGGGVFLIMILFLMFVFMRSLRIKKMLNRSLNEQSFELTRLNKELNSSNDELRAQQEILKASLESLKNTQDQLIQTEKMASLGLLAADVAVEINNPLDHMQEGILALETYFKHRQKDQPNEITNFIEAIQEGVIRAAAIVNSMNEYSHEDDLSREMCDIRTIIENCLLMLQNETKDRIEIKKDYSIITNFLLCKQGKMNRALFNILTNAVDSIELQGIITISTMIENNSMIISIKDTGCGIPKEDLPKIFDPFFTTKDPGKGTGLGLSTCFNTIKEHQGTINVESEPGKGTTVRIILPLNPI
jgi:signal transduction histidine kinase